MFSSQILLMRVQLNIGCSTSRIMSNSQIAPPEERDLRIAINTARLASWRYLGCMRLPEPHDDIHVP